MVKGMTGYQFSKRFKKEYKTLPKNIWKVFDEKLQLFLRNISHPSLRVKHIHGTKKQLGRICNQKPSLYVPIHGGTL